MAGQILCVYPHGSEEKCRRYCPNQTKSYVNEIWSIWKRQQSQSDQQLTWANKDKSHKEPDATPRVASIIMLAPGRHRTSIHEFERPAWFHQTGTSSPSVYCALPESIWLSIRYILFLRTFGWWGHSSSFTPSSF